MKNNIRNKVYSMVDDQVFSQAWHVWKQVSDQVSVQVLSQVEGIRFRFSYKDSTPQLWLNLWVKNEKQN